MALARSENSSQRFYSMSAQIRQERAASYHILEQTQKRTWILRREWSGSWDALAAPSMAQQTVLSTVLAKARSWERMKGVAINDRQRLVLNRLLDGFEGKLTTTKYAKLTKSSQDTALRDLRHLVKQGILVRSSEGNRSTSYALASVP
jgi:Fic family protein